MVLDSSPSRHGKIFYIEVLRNEGNPTLRTQPKLMKLSSVIIFLNFCLCLPIPLCKVDGIFG